MICGLIQTLRSLAAFLRQFAEIEGAAEELNRTLYDRKESHAA